MRFSATANYFPITRGLYEIAAGLKPLGTDFGNGAADSQVFQIDHEFARFRKSKLACRQDRFDKYFLRADLSVQAEQLLIDWIIQQFVGDYPELFSFQTSRLFCRHTGDEISIGERGQLLADSKLTADYRDVFDALANQVSEDICLMQTDDSRDWLAAAHVCSPGHWSAEQKIGRPFTAIHEPVAGIEPINRNAKQFVQMMIHRGPMVRFAWGITMDDRLNHHPDPPDGIAAADWHSRSFDPQNPSLFLRVERQVTWGFPGAGAAAFIIRVFHLSSEQIRGNPQQRDQLISALKSMTPASRRYKGIEGSVDAIIDWLGSR